MGQSPHEGVTCYLRWCVGAGNERKTDSIFVAAELGRLEKIKEFKQMTKHFDINATDSVGRTALMWAADCGQLVRRATFSPRFQFPTRASVRAPSTPAADCLDGGEVSIERESELILEGVWSGDVRNRHHSGQPTHRPLRWRAPSVPVGRRTRSSYCCGTAQTYIWRRRGLAGLSHHARLG